MIDGLCLLTYLPLPGTSKRDVPTKHYTNTYHAEYVNWYRQSEYRQNNTNIWAGSAVGIATGYGLDGPGVESRWGRDFSHLSRPALWPTQPPVQWVPGLSRGERAAGA